MTEPKPTAPAAAETTAPGDTSADASGRPRGAELRRLKGIAQRISNVTRLGHAGVTPAFVAGVSRELANHELVKVKFTDFKDQRHELADQIAAATGSHVVTVIGHVAVLYRKKSEAPADAD